MATLTITDLIPVFVGENGTSSLHRGIGGSFVLEISPNLHQALKLGHAQTRLSLLSLLA
jgi:hypothetical protein